MDAATRGVIATVMGKHFVSRIDGLVSVLIKFWHKEMGVSPGSQMGAGADVVVDGYSFSDDPAELRAVAISVRLVTSSTSGPVVALKAAMRSAA